jgi:hypothetical protein
MMKPFHVTMTGKMEFTQAGIACCKQIGFEISLGAQTCDWYSRVSLKGQFPSLHTPSVPRRVRDAWAGGKIGRRGEEGGGGEINLTQTSVLQHLYFLASSPHCHVWTSSKLKDVVSVACAVQRVQSTLL